MNKQSLLVGCASILLLSISNTQVWALDNLLQLSPEHIQNLGIEVGPLEAVTKTPVLSAPAKVVIPPAHEYVVSATQGGILTQLRVSLGDSVQKGQVVAEINSPELLMLQRQFLKASNDLALITNLYQRDQKLLHEGVIADRRAHETASQYQAALTDVSEAKQLLEIAGMPAADVEQLSHTHRFNSLLNIYAPVTGVVMERMAVAGARIDALAPLYRIANLEELWLEINVPQERMADIHLGDKALIEHTETAASISLFGKSVHPENQTVLVRASIKGQPAGIRAGQHVNAQIICSEITAAFKLPDAAIAQNEGKAYIFVKNANGFVATEVRVIGKEGAASIIKGQLSGNEQLALKGAVALKARWLGLGSAE
jgi:membrane fusion protein, heavy metal efflux system